MKKLATVSRAVGKTIALTTALAFLLFVGFVLAANRSPADAAGGGKPAASPLYNDNVAYAPAPSWNGCGFGVNGGGTIGRITGPFGPVGMDTDTGFGGIHLRCALQAGTLVFGVEGSHAWNFGDAHDLGIERDMSFVGKVGAIVLPNTQVYVGGGWSRLGLGAGIPVDHVDGWKLIGGVELKLSSAMPLFLDVRYEYGMYDIKDLAPAIFDASTHSVRVGLTYQFGTMGLGSRAAPAK